MEKNPFENRLPKLDNQNKKEQLGSVEIAQLSDAEAYRDIRLEALTKNPEAFGEKLESASQKTIDQWREDILGDKKFVVLAKIDSSLTGAVSLASGLKDLKVEGLYHIIEVYTRPDYRQRGLSERVLEKALEEIRNRKGLRVSLGVKTGPEQEKAVGLYKKLGFKIVGTDFDEKLRKLKIKDKNDYGYYIMLKNLAK